MSLAASRRKLHCADVSLALRARSLPPNVTGPAPGQVGNYVGGLDLVIRIAVLRLEPEPQVRTIWPRNEGWPAPPASTGESEHLHDGDPPQGRPHRDSDRRPDSHRPTKSSALRHTFVSL